MKTPSPHIERAPLLAVFGEHAQRILRLVRERPELLQTLLCAPRRAIHATGAFLHLAPEADLDDAEVAGIIADHHPRDLLKLACPDAPAQLFRVLDRCGERVQSRRFYERLFRLISSPLADDVLRAPHLDLGRLAEFERWFDLHPRIFDLRHAFAGSLIKAQAADMLFEILRDHGVMDHGDLVIPDGAGTKAIFSRLLAALDQITAPAVPFVLPPEFRIIESVGELRKVGQKFENCLTTTRGSEHWFRLIDGTEVFIVSDEMPLVAMLRRVAPTTWVLGDVTGQRNRYVRRDARAELLKTLRDSGVHLLDEPPETAIHVLHDALDADDGGNDEVAQFRAAMHEWLIEDQEDQENQEE